MTTIAVLDASGATVYLEGTGTGSALDPFVPNHNLKAGATVAVAGVVPTAGTSVVTTATIANAANDSAEVDIRAARALGLEIPASFDGTVITFKVCSVTGGTFQALRDINNAVVTMTVQASTSYDLPGELTAWPYMKVSATTAQTGATDLVVVAKT